jgi:hypothetical protein
MHQGFDPKVNTDAKKDTKGAGGTIRGSMAMLPQKSLVISCPKLAKNPYNIC